MKLIGILSALLIVLALMMPGCTTLHGTNWSLSELNGQSATFDEHILINFKDDKITGSDGCNNYSASCRVKYGQFSLTSNIATTMMVCPEPVMKKAAMFTSILTAAATYRIGGEHLTLFDAAGKPVATFTKRCNELSGTSWIATGINNGKKAVVSIIGDSRITVEFSADGKISGSAGCNNYTAAYEISENKIRIAPAASTRKVCADPSGLMEQEIQFLKAFEMADAYRINGNYLELRSVDGALAVKFVRYRENL